MKIANEWQIFLIKCKWCNAKPFCKLVLWQNYVSAHHILQLHQLSWFNMREWHKEWAARVVKLEMQVGVDKMCCAFRYMCIIAFMTNFTQNTSTHKHVYQSRGRSCVAHSHLSNTLDRKYLCYRESLLLAWWLISEPIHLPVSYRLKLKKNMLECTPSLPVNVGARSV